MARTARSSNSSIDAALSPGLTVSSCPQNTANGTRANGHCHHSLGRDEMKKLEGR
jgi:hypothetical protein